MVMSTARKGSRRGRQLRALKEAVETAALVADLPGATATTLSHRLPILARGAINPKAANPAEMTRMVTEKVAAGAEAAQAVSLGVLHSAAAMAAYLTRVSKTNAALASFWLKPERGSEIHRFARNGLLSAEDAAELAEGLAAIATRTVRRTVSPAHRRVTANAKRLSAIKSKRSRQRS